MRVDANSKCHPALAARSMRVAIITDKRAWFMILQRSRTNTLGQRLRPAVHAALGQLSSSAPASDALQQPCTWARIVVAAFE